jgi:hypothetical protein
MKLSELPLDTWVVIEPVLVDEVNLLSTHDTQHEAEVECSRRNQGLHRPRYSAIKALEPIAGAQGCVATLASYKPTH